MARSGNYMAGILFGSQAKFGSEDKATGNKERVVASFTPDVRLSHPGRIQLWQKGLVPTAPFTLLVYKVGQKDSAVAITAKTNDGRHNGTVADNIGDHLSAVYRAGVTGEVSLVFDQPQHAVDIARAVGLAPAIINRLQNSGKKTVQMPLKTLVQNLEDIRAVLEREGVTTF